MYNWVIQARFISVVGLHVYSQCTLPVKTPYEKSFNNFVFGPKVGGMQ